MNAGTWIGGDVVIDPTAAIAPGVLIQADPDCRVIIGAGACIGMGTVIHAVGGDITIGLGANLGAGVLVYGKLEIGQQACIGASASVINCSIPPAELVPAGSLLAPPPPVEVSTSTTQTTVSVNGQTPPSDTTAKDDRLRIHAKMHLQQFLSRIFISGA